MANAAHLVERADALADIQEDGMAATLYVSNPDVSPAWDPNYNADTGTTIYVLRLKETTTTEGGMTLSDEIEMMVAQSPDALDIKVWDEIEMDSIRRTVKTAKPFAPGGTIIYWDVTIGRG